MKEIFETLKRRLKGVWKGEGSAKYPTIQPTFYTRSGNLNRMNLKMRFTLIKKPSIKIIQRKTGKLFFGTQDLFCLKMKKFFW